MTPTHLMAPAKRAAAWEDFVKRFTIERPLPVMLGIHVSTLSDDPVLFLTIDVYATDVETGKPHVNATSREIPADMYADTERALLFVRDCVRNRYEHEADEGITYKGVRVFDPHKSGQHLRSLL